MTDDIILNEIKKNGNTNLISKSNLPSKSQIFAIGDSHTIFYYNSMKIKEHWFYTNKLPLTIYTLLKMDLDLYKIGDILGNGHDKYNIKTNDYVLFYFGYNDIQKNIEKYAENNYKNEIKQLIINYINYIIKLVDKFKINAIVPCIYPNARINAVGVNCIGSHKNRQQYTEYANKILKNECLKNNLSFLDVYDYLVDIDGYIKSEVTRDYIHLDYDNKKVREYIESEIYKFCK